MSTTEITLGADVGGRVAGETINSPLLDLRRRLAACQGSYCTEIDELALVLRVDGDIAAWNFEGIEKLRLAKKQRYITVDIGVPIARWQCDPHELRQYLEVQVRVALTAMLGRLSKAKIIFDADRFWKAVDPALHMFLTQAPSDRPTKS